MVKITQKKPHFPKSLICIVILLIVLVTFLKVTNKMHLFGKQAVPGPRTTASQNTKGETPLPTQQSAQNQPSHYSSTPTSAPQPGDQKGVTSDNNDITLIAPTGDFVSAHKTRLNDSVSSVCNTTASATCQIIFTKGVLTKSLVATQTDRGGSAYWNSWKPDDIGLTVGTWTVQAIATLGGQSKTVYDALSLEVSQ